MMPAPGLLLAGALALGALALPRRRRGSGSPVAATWSADPSETLPAGAPAFLDALAALVPDVPIYVTDGTRSPEDQAEAMWDKLIRGEDLRALYARDDLVEEFLAAGSLTDAIGIIAAQVARGDFISRHLRGDAIDLRTRNLNADQAQRLEAAAQQLGAKTVHESDHLHIERIPHA